MTVESDHKPLQSIFKKSLLHTPCHLQRMILRLQRYNIDITYKLGEQMCLADHVKDTGREDELEMEELNAFNILKINSEKLPKLQKGTNQDSVLQLSRVSS